MTPEELAALKPIYRRAVELTNTEERAAYLDAACATDPAMRSRVEQMFVDEKNADLALGDVACLQGKTVGYYQILEKVAEGASGIIYKALDTRLERLVILKFLPHQLMYEAEAMRRFRQEAQCLSALKHANIVTIYGIESFGGAVALVMEYVDGESLAARMARGPLPVPIALSYAEQIAAALAAAHSQSIVHRDLKPSNVLVRPNGAVKVVDFGLAKATLGSAPSQDDQTPPGSILGTFGYMAPEQVRGEEADVRSDLFCLGVILYEMLSGQRAFNHTSPGESLAAVLRDPVPELGSPVPASLAALVGRCLEKSPDARPQTAAELLSALRAVAGTLKRNQMLRASKRRWRRTAFIAGAGSAAASVVLIALSHPGSIQALADAQSPAPAVSFERAIELQRQAIATGCFGGGQQTCDLKSAMASIRASLTEFDAILKAHPDHISSHWNRGLAYADLGALLARTADWSHAIDACDHAIADFGQALKPGQTYEGLPTRRPDEADVLFNRGMTHQQKADIPVLDPGIKLLELSRAIADFDHILSGSSRFEAFLQRRGSEVIAAKRIAENRRAAVAKDQVRR